MPVTLLVSCCYQAAQQIDLAFVHADVVSHLALPDDRLVDAAQVHVAVTLEMSSSTCIETSPLSCTCGVGRRSRRRRCT